MKKLFLKWKQLALYGFVRYGFIIGAIWLISFIIMLPIMFIYGGWSLVVAYIICKLTGVCPI